MTAPLRVLTPLSLTPTTYLVVMFVVIIRVIGRALVLKWVGGVTHRVLRLTQVSLITELLKPVGGRVLSRLCPLHRKLMLAGLHTPRVS